jgi:nitroreductase
MPLTLNSRTADHSIDPVFLERWSPRAYDGQPVPREDLMTMLEAARWAPSSYNSQPWRFLYAIKDGPHWEQFLGLLVEFNRSWCKDAGALLVLLSKSTMTVPGKEGEVPSHSHSHDAGAGWAYFALQATRMGYQAHGMVGFDMDRAFTELGVPIGYRVEQMIAVGRRGDPARLPESVRAREQPNARRPIGESAFEGTFPAG